VEPAAPEHGQRTRIAASRARRHAAQRSSAPPLAWDDELIDDPAAAPARSWKRPPKRRSADLAEEAEELFRREAYTREHAAARLGVSRSALDMALHLRR
jgi:hypothetical protein